MLQKNVGRALTAQEQQEFENLQRSLESMPDDNPEAGGDPDAAGGSGNNGGTKDLSPEEAAQRAIAEERKRIADISALCRSILACSRMSIFPVDSPWIR